MNYGDALRSVAPGGFIPDVGSAGSETPNVAPIPGGPAEAGPSFKDTVRQMLTDVNDKIVSSDQAQRDLAAGRTNDLQGVVTSVEEANLSLEFTMAMRSKLLEAYQEISRMQI